MCISTIECTMKSQKISKMQLQLFNIKKDLPTIYSDRGSLDQISLDQISWSKVSNNLGVWSNYSINW
jgi:hypothetical protein